MPKTSFRWNYNVKCAQITCHGYFNENVQHNQDVFFPAEKLLNLSADLCLHVQQTCPSTLTALSSSSCCFSQVVLHQKTFIFSRHSKFALKLKLSISCANNCLTTTSKAEKYWEESRFPLLNLRLSVNNGAKNKSLFAMNLVACFGDEGFHSVKWTLWNIRALCIVRPETVINICIQVTKQKILLLK